VIISLAPYQTSSNAIIKFRSTSGWGNQLFIDNINIDNNVSVNNAESSDDFNVYPNPGTGTFYLQTEVLQGKEVQIEVYNELGEMILNNQVILGHESIKVDLSSQKSGFYFVRIISKDFSSVKKLILYRSGQ
jgi:hypothetical protein